MSEPLPGNNELYAAEQALRKIGSNVWFSGLSDEWQDFLISNTVEHFDTYELSMHEAAMIMIQVFPEADRKQPRTLAVKPLGNRIEIILSDRCMLIPKKHIELNYC
ncbi:hypothetical protein [Endozoicomonas ascidiicola]|uniref:hypothetical protein n=1 Tax=Endozoicomonas ascidiicola TaxID=1698521 RepID=UPI0008331036|nr:hypothetical protein [Endozoicomonas ascidiicola]